MVDDRDLYPEGSLELPGKPIRKSTYLKPKRAKFPLKKIIIVLIIIALLVAAGFAARYFINKTGTVPSANDQSAATNAPPSQDAGPKDDVPKVTDTKTHKSAQPRVEFSYPSSWTVTEDDNGIRVTSPEF